MLSRAFPVAACRDRPLLTPDLSVEEGTDPSSRARLLLQLKLLTLMSTEVLQVTFFFSKYPRLQTPESI